MKFRNIRLCIISVFCIVALFSSNSVLGQNRRIVQPQNRGGEPELSEENQRTMSEIKMLQETLNERKEQEARQRQVLLELKEAVDAVSKGRPQPQQVQQTISTQSSQPSQSSYPTQQQRVTSGSTLSRIEAAEREEILSLEKKFSLEMQVAQREIDLLKKQLEIANKQIDKYSKAGMSTNPSPAGYYPGDGDASTYVIPEQRSQNQRGQTIQPQQQQRQKSKQPKQPKQDNKKQGTQSIQSKQRQDVQPQPAQSGGLIDLPPDIKKLQEQLKRREAMQAEQLELIKELKKQADSMSD